MRRPDPEDARASFVSDPRRRCRAELYTLLLTFVFHSRNNHMRKALTMLLAIVWAVLYVASALDSVSVTIPAYFNILTAFIFIIVGRMWDIEITSFSQLVESNNSNRTQSRSEGDE